MISPSSVLYFRFRLMFIDAITLTSTDNLYSQHPSCFHGRKVLAPSGLFSCTQPLAGQTFLFPELITDIYKQQHHCVHHSSYFISTLNNQNCTFYLVLNQSARWFNNNYLIRWLIIIITYLSSKLGLVIDFLLIDKTSAKNVSFFANCIRLLLINVFNQIFLWNATAPVM